MNDKVFEIKSESFLNSLNLEQLKELEVLVKYRISDIRRENYRKGVKRELFAVGDKVRFTGRPSRASSYKTIKQYMGVVCNIFGTAYRVQSDEVPYTYFLRSADQLERIEGGN